MYWAVNSNNVKFGGTTVLSDKPTQMILDNGMSFAMAPQKQFVKLIQSLV